MANASLDPIKERLSGVDTYHPVDAETFSDWTLEAGDTVTLKRGGDEYESPVHTSKMVWRGTPKISLSSTGNKEREAISKVSKKKYRGGSGAMRNEQWLHREFYSEDGYFHSELNMTEYYLRTEFDDMYNGLSSRIEQTAAYWQAEFVDMYNGLASFVEITAQHFTTAFDDFYNGVNSRFEATASYWRNAIENVYTGLSTRVEQTENSWSATVQAIGSDGVINAGTIAVAINNAGESEAHIDANKVYIGNSKSTTIINGKCTLSDVSADYISGQLATLALVTVKNLSVTSGGYISLASGDGSVSITGANASDILRGIKVVDTGGNTYKLQGITYGDASWHDIPNTTFSKAVTPVLSGSWSSGTLTVTSNPSATANYVRTLVQKGTTWTGNTATAPIYVQYGDSGQYEEDTGWSISVDASSRYTAGSPASGVATGRSGSSYDWDFTITKGDNTTKTLTINCSDIYADARSGYTQGTFTLQTITLQGTATSSLTLQGAAATTSTATLLGQSEMVYVPASAGGTIYYMAGTAVNRYLGNGTTVTGRGDSVTVTPIGNAVRFKRHTSSEKPTGTWYSIVNSGNDYDLTYYLAKDAVNYYKGNGSSVVGRGTSESITPIGSSSLRLNSAIRYISGGSLTYYPATETLYKGGNNVGVLYNAGTVDSTHYYTKS